MRTGVARAAGLALLMAGGASPAALAEPLSGGALESAISGKHVFLAIPLGGEFPLYYRSNGVVDGISPKSLLARLDPDKDSGKWWISGNQLCQQWKLWYDQKKYCFTLESTGPGSLNWTRDDGLSGKARIGD